MRNDENGGRENLLAREPAAAGPWRRSWWCSTRRSRRPAPSRTG
jgi:hypothetical protein